MSYLHLLMCEKTLSLYKSGKTDNVELQVPFAVCRFISQERLGYAVIAQPPKSWRPSKIKV